MNWTKGIGKDENQEQMYVRNTYFKWKEPKCKEYWFSFWPLLKFLDPRQNFSKSLKILKYLLTTPNNPRNHVTTPSTLIMPPRYSADSIFTHCFTHFQIRISRHSRLFLLFFVFAFSFFYNYKEKVFFFVFPKTSMFYLLYFPS